MLFGYSNAFTIEGLLLATLTGWSPDQPSSYTIGDFTYTWARDGNTWTWTVTDSTEAVPPFVVTLTATSSGWDVAFSQDGNQWLSGSINNGGSQGTAVFVDPSDPSAGSVTTVWEPDGAPYVVQFTITGTGSFASFSGTGATTAIVNLETDTTGDNWQWAYSDNGTPPNTDSDEYPGLIE